jgi:hypothetical protein
VLLSKQDTQHFTIIIKNQYGAGTGKENRSMDKENS